jgi:hypothetical protein
LKTVNIQLAIPLTITQNLSCFGSGGLSLAGFGVYFHVKKFQALFPRTWLLRWALHSPSFLAARWFLGRPGFGLGTAWSYEEFARVSLRQQQ